MTRNPTLAAEFWSDALTISERCEILRKKGQLDMRLSADETAASEKRLKRWRSQPQFQDPEQFYQRRSIEGITEAELYFVLGKDPRQIVDPSAVPGWARWLTQALAANHPNNLVPVEDIAKWPQAGLLVFVAPWAHQACVDLRQRLADLLDGHDNPPCCTEKVISSFEKRLQTNLLLASISTLVLELNVARVMDDLEGGNSEDRFKTFQDRLRDPDERLRIALEYPVLSRQLTRQARLWVDSVFKFTQHLLDDWPDIGSTFSPNSPPGVLTEIIHSAGDSHRGGQSVCLLRFSSGFRLVFKPRPMSIDRHFQKLVVWINERSDFGFRPLVVLDRGDHGWVEWVENTPCDDLSAVERYYRRQGGYLALLYALDASDFHYENIIAANDQPMMIDLESLFQPRVDPVGSEMFAQRPAFLLPQETVLRVGLLPAKMPLEPKSGSGYDISGFGGENGQLVADIPRWSDAGTDKMHLEKTTVAMSEKLNRPTLNGTTVRAGQYADLVEEGFTSLYNVIREHRKELLSETGPLAAFENDTIRPVLRPTRTYFKILKGSLHSDFQQNALLGDLFLDCLWQGRIGEQWNQVALAERRDLRRGDIPVFSAKTGSRDLWDSEDRRFVDFLRTSSMEYVRARIKGLGEEDFRRQQWCVQASLALLGRPTSEETLELPDANSTTVTDEPEGFLQEAIKVGDYLIDIAFNSKNDASWIGLKVNGTEGVHLTHLGFDLYGGQLGIAYFFAYLGMSTGEERFSRFARMAIAVFRSALAEDKIEEIDGIGVGAFAGMGGWVYVLTHLSALWNDDTLLDEADKILPHLMKKIGEDEALDVIAGAAGGLCALVARYKYRPSAIVAEAAIGCGERLLDAAQRMDSGGLGWMTSISKGFALSGFSHGIAGIAWALAAGAEICGNERFRSAAREALDYEHGLFSQEYGTWPNLLEVKRIAEEDGETYVPIDSWCHGTSGIGLSRLRMLHLWQEDKQITTDLRRALDFTLVHGLSSNLNHSLCHGAFGNLELILEAARSFDPSLHSVVRTMASQALGSVRENGWRCGVPFRVKTPGLMTGLAGIGYGLLRCVDALGPDAPKVPSVLVLDPPKG
ncbi:MAG: type 2 lantipeptide synthetase LanM [bacterium]|nr:type 2 lantipeptide synthetase LanM [bacterium]